MGQPVLIHLRTVPGRSSRVAKSLARRSDVRFVALLAGRADIVCEVLVADRSCLARVLLDEIQTEDWIGEVSTEIVLKTFKTTYDWSRDILGDSAAGLQRIDRSIVRKITPDHVDLLIMAALMDDGRRSYADLSAELGLSETTVARRISRLVAADCLHFGTLIDPLALGYQVEAFVQLRVELAEIESVAETLARLPEVRYLAATSGYSDLVCETVLHDTDALYDFNTRVLGHLRGIKQTETNLELATVKRAFRYPPVGSELFPGRCDGPFGDSAAPTAGWTERGEP